MNESIILDDPTYIASWSSWNPLGPYEGKWFKPSDSADQDPVAYFILRDVGGLLKTFLVCIKVKKM